MSERRIKFARFSKNSNIDILKIESNHSINYFITVILIPNMTIKNQNELLIGNVWDQRIKQELIIYS